MPTVATKTAASFSRRGKKYTKAPTPCTYAEAIELQAQSERGEIPEMVVKITPQEHANAIAQPAEPASDPDAPAAAPTDPAERATAITEAASQLDLDNEGHYTKVGLPDARALSNILGWTVTAAERDSAFSVDKQPKGNITIKGKGASEPLDTGAGAAGENAGGDGSTGGEGGEGSGTTPDPSTAGAVTV